MKLPIIAACALALAAMATTATAAPRRAQCEVMTDGQSWTGPCLFSPEGGGSFSISRPGERPFPGGYGVISVTLTEPGEAEVSGLTRGGINSRWGEASRSRRQPACWVGADFRVCAR
jgi:hypothetical protein